MARHLGLNLSWAAKRFWDLDEQSKVSEFLSKFLSTSKRMINALCGLQDWLWAYDKHKVRCKPLPNC